jgi:hypothetical protein
MKIASCLQTKRISAPCSACGAGPDIVHLYGDKPAIYCSSCCPACVDPLKQGPASKAPHASNKKGHRV